jgi:Spy/CpxP family protein refolding chaperone
MMARHGDMMMMASNFFAPELVMCHQVDIGLTPDQQTALREEVVKFTAHVTDLRWQQCAESEALAALLKAAKPDEKVILAQEEKVLKIENDLKLSHLATLIRIKNALTPEQQAKLTEMKKHMEFHMWRSHMMRDGQMGFHPGFGFGPAFGPGMGQGGFPMHGEGMGGPGHEVPANPPPPPPPSAPLPPSDSK